MKIQSGLLEWSFVLSRAIREKKNQRFMEKTQKLFWKNKYREIKNVMNKQNTLNK